MDILEYYEYYKTFTIHSDSNLWAISYELTSILVYYLQEQSGASLWFPPIAIATVFLLRSGKRLFFLIILIDLPIAFLQFDASLMAVLVSTSTSLEALCFAFLIERYRLSDGASAIVKLANMTGLAAVSAAFGVSLGIMSSVAVDALSVTEVPPVWLQWWLGDWTSLVAFTPPLILFLTRWPEMTAGLLASRRTQWHAGCAVASVVAIAMIDFHFGLIHITHIQSATLFMLPVIWSSFRMSAGFTSGLLMLISVMSAVAAASGSGETVMVAGIDLHRLGAQVGNIVVVIAGISLALALDRERANKRQADELKERLAAIVDTAMVGIITVDDRLNIVAFNQHAEELFGWSAQDMIGGPLDRLVDPKIRSDHAGQMNRFLQGAPSRKPMSDWRHVVGVHRTGRLLPVEAALSRVELDGASTMTVVLRDMTEIQQYEDNLARALNEEKRQRKRAEEANHAKSEFLAAMSHELRTPLNAVIGFASMIENELHGRIRNAKYPEYAANIRTSGEHLLSLINDVLDLSRVESKHQSIAPDSVCLGELFDELQSMMVTIATKRNILISFGKTSDLRVAADRRAILQVLINLLTNAIKFSPKDSVVTVEVIQGPDNQISISVTDRGVGIPAEKMANLGTPFTQVHGPYVNKEQGAGLGLAISKSLLEAMGGMIDFHSVEGQGTCVTVTLQAAGPN